MQQEGGPRWNKINIDTDLGKAWLSLEGGSADVSLNLSSTSARRLKKPQPHAGPHDVPLRRSYLLLDDGTVLTTDWEAWGTMSPASQVRPLVAPQRRLYLVLFGKEVGEDDAGDEPDQLQQREEARERKWQALPRELKLAIKRVRENLGHASQPALLRALRIALASEVAIKAARLFRCPECPRLREPRRPRPSKLPIANEFNIMIGIDIFNVKDSAGESWTFLNTLRQGTSYQVCTLLGETHGNPTGRVVLEALNSSWINWAGYPERGIVTDRAKYFLAELAEDFWTRMPGRTCGFGITVATWTGREAWCDMEADLQESGLVAASGWFAGGPGVDRGHQPEQELFDKEIRLFAGPVGSWARYPPAGRSGRRC